MSVLIEATNKEEAVISEVLDSEFGLPFGTEVSDVFAEPSILGPAKTLRDAIEREYPNVQKALRKLDSLTSSLATELETKTTLKPKGSTTVAWLFLQSVEGTTDDGFGTYKNQFGGSLSRPEFELLMEALQENGGLTKLVDKMYNAVTEWIDTVGPLKEFADDNEIPIGVLQDVQKELNDTIDGVTDISDRFGDTRIDGVFELEISSREYFLFDDNDTAEVAARESIINAYSDVGEAKALLGDNFVNHIDEDALRRDLRVDAANLLNTDVFDGERDEEIADSLEKDIDELDDDIRQEWLDDNEDRLVNETVDEWVDDAASFLSDDVLERYYNPESVADEILRHDGWQWELARYDGNSTDLVDGWVMARSN